MCASYEGARPGAASALANLPAAGGCPSPAVARGGDTVQASGQPATLRSVMPVPAPSPAYVFIKRIDWHAHLPVHHASGVEVNALPPNPGVPRAQAWSLNFTGDFGYGPVVLPGGRKVRLD